MSDEAPVIEIRDLHKAYGQLEVLKGVSITARKGKVVSLIGSSGSGKSTLLRCCNLLEESQQGEVLFCGEPVTWRGTGSATVPKSKHRPADTSTRSASARNAMCFPRSCPAVSSSAPQ